MKPLTPSEWAVWEWSIFNDADYETRKAAWFIPAIPPIVCVGALTLGWLGVFIMLFVFMVSNLLWWTVPELGRIHKLHGLPAHGWSANALRRLGEKYLDLSKEDRKEYPHDFLEIIKDPLLTAAQEKELIKTFDDLNFSIQQRNYEREQLTRKHVDITAALQIARDNTAGVEEERKVLKELA